MSNGLGAGFSALTLPVVLAMCAGAGTVVAALALVLRERGGAVRTVLQGAALVLLAVVVGVAGFGVLAMYDEAAFAAWILLGSVFFPLGAAVVQYRRRTAWAWTDVLGGATLAWGPSYVLAAAVFVGVISVTDLSLAAVMALAAAVAAGATLIVGRVLADRWLASPA